MPERTEITQKVQIGVEGAGTPGTAVAATKTLGSMSIRPSANPEVKTFRPAGTKYPTVTALGREWSALAVSGQPVYDELQYLLASVAGTPTVTVTGVTGQSWAFNPSTFAEDVPRTFTIESGSAVRAMRTAYSLFSGFTLNFNREELSIEGEGVGRAIEDGVTLTAGTTSLPLVPVLPGQGSVFLDTTSAGLGTTRLTRVLGGSISVGSRFAPLWTVDASQASFATHVEIEPAVSLQLTVEADAAGMALLGHLRSGVTRFIRLNWVGGIIGAGPAVYSLTFDVAAKINEIGDFGSEQGVTTVQFTAAAAHDATWAKAWTATLVNAQAAL